MKTYNCMVTVPILNCTDSAQVIGKTGRVTKVDGMDIHVMVNDQKFIFNSSCLTPTEAPLPPKLEDIRADGKACECENQGVSMCQTLALVCVGMCVDASL